MLKALVESAPGFERLSPIGYEQVSIRWVIDVSQGPGQAELLGPYERGDLAMFVPVRGEKSGTVSESNLKPGLLVENAEYALGLSEGKAIARESLKHRGFRSLIHDAAQATGDGETQVIDAFLQEHWAKQSSEIERRVLGNVKPKDKVTFRAGPSGYPFERAPLQKFWCDYLRREYSTGHGYCVVCGRAGLVLRVLPWQVTIFAGYSSPISSFNETAFTSFGKEQTANSPLCFDCASTASSILQFLADRRNHHSRELARDENKGAGKAPLKNQLAIFWVKKAPKPEASEQDAELEFDLQAVEAMLAEPITTGGDRDGPPPDTSHVDALYALPWSASAKGLQIAKSRFYVAVLSPNKSRLVLREWIDVSLDAACTFLKTYDTARTIISADGHSVDRVPVQEMLKGLRPWKSRSAGDDANLIRGLIRAAYTGAPPPPELLTMAVQRFRVPVRPKKNEENELKRRQQAQAAAIKLVLTYGTEEAITLQCQSSEGRSGPHLCGELLAVLEEAQLRASRWRINATLVDRFYGGASSSPSTTLGGLVKQATQAHMPKIRKAGLGYEKLEQSLESVMKEIDQQGGFPSTLTLRQQGEFALGFYLRRGAFRADRPKREPAHSEAASGKPEEAK